MFFIATVLTYRERQRAVQRHRPPLLSSLAGALFERGFAAMVPPPPPAPVGSPLRATTRNAVVDAAYQDTFSRDVAVATLPLARSPGSGDEVLCEICSELFRAIIMHIIIVLTVV